MLALSLTPQLGATRVRRLFERIPRVEDIFRAPLTELEAAGLPAASAQSIALGDSLRLADEELKKLAKASGVTLVTMGSELYPEQLERFMIRRWSFMCGAMLGFCLRWELR